MGKMVESELRAKLDDEVSLSWQELRASDLSGAGQQAQHVHELKAWGLKQVTIAAVVGLSPSRVSRILSQGL